MSQDLPIAIFLHFHTQRPNWLLADTLTIVDHIEAKLSSCFMLHKELEENPALH